MGSSISVHQKFAVVSIKWSYLRVAKEVRIHPTIGDLLVECVAHGVVWIHGYFSAAFDGSPG